MNVWFRIVVIMVLSSLALAMPSLANTMISTGNNEVFSISNATTPFEEHMNFAIRKLNSTHYQVNVSMDSEFINEVGTCIGYLSDNNPETDCDVKKVSKKWLKDKDLKAENFTRMKDYPITVLTSKVKVDKNTIDYSKGNFSFLVSLEGGMREEKIKLGFSSIFITMTNESSSYRAGSYEVFRGFGNNLYILNLNRSGTSGDAHALHLFNSTDNVTFTFQRLLAGINLDGTGEMYSNSEAIVEICDGREILMTYIQSNNIVQYRRYNYTNDTLTSAMEVPGATSASPGHIKGNSDCSVVWLTYRNNSQGIIYLANTTDTSIVPSNVQSIRMSRYNNNVPHSIAVDSSGTVHIVVENRTSVTSDRRSISYVNYSSGSFSDPKVILGGDNTTLANFSPYHRGFFVFNNSLFLFARNSTGSGTTGDLGAVYFTRSDNQGTTWTTAINLTNTTQEWWITATINSTDDIIAFLSDLSLNLTYRIESADLGTTWTSMTLLSSQRLLYSPRGSPYLDTNNYSTVNKIIDLMIENSTSVPYSFYYQRYFLANSLPSISAANSTTNATARISDSVNPTDNNTFVNFTIAFSDADSESIRLFVCRTNAFNPDTASCNSEWARSGSYTTSSPVSINFSITPSESNDSYEWFAFAYDGLENSTPVSGNFSVNHPPNMTSINLSITTPSGTDAIACIGIFSDPDSGDNSTYNYTWWVNSIAASGNNTANNTPNNLSAVANDKITCSAYPTDNHGYAGTLFSLNTSIFATVQVSPSSGGGGGGGGAVISSLCGNFVCEYGEDNNNCNEDCKNVTFRIQQSLYFQQAEPGGLLECSTNPFGCPALRILNPTSTNSTLRIFFEQANSLDKSFNWAKFGTKGGFLNSIDIVVPGGNEVQAGSYDAGFIVQPPNETELGDYIFNIRVSVKNDESKTRVVPFTIRVSKGGTLSSAYKFATTPLVSSRIQALDFLTMPITIIGGIGLIGFMGKNMKGKKK